MSHLVKGLLLCLLTCLSTWQGILGGSEFLQELKCYFCYFGILVGMPSCQGHILLAGSKVKGTHPCTSARGKVPTGGHGKGYFLSGKRKCFIITCILNQCFRKIRDSWYLKHFVLISSWKNEAAMTIDGMYFSGVECVLWSQTPVFKFWPCHWWDVWSQALYLIASCYL